MFVRGFRGSHPEEEIEKCLHHIRLIRKNDVAEVWITGVHSIPDFHNHNITMPKYLLSIPVELPLFRASREQETPDGLFRAAICNAAKPLLPPKFYPIGQRRHSKADSTILSLVVDFAVTLSDPPHFTL